jgi:hypothetical protein
MLDAGAVAAAPERHSGAVAAGAGAAEHVQEIA